MKWTLLAAPLLFSSSVMAAQLDAIRSCHEKPLPAPRAPETELIVAIDQTTPLSPSLKQMVADNVKAYLQPGHAFSIAVFSAYTQGRYTEVLASGRIEAALPKAVRDDISKPVLNKFEQCLGRQPAQAMQVAGTALRSAFAESSGSIAKSDVLASLKAVSALAAESRAPQKIVLIVSDMLENSSVGNFYAEQGKSVRKIDAGKELRSVEDNKLLGNFGGAKVYVIGAGLLSVDAANAKSYRDPKTMQALAEFWSAYMQKSHAELVEFGQPALLRPMRQ
ncbi:hypothetical protein GTP41_10045 [Pseudoduganella sp. DS3]|uniref:VWA domain-containing protein n=1 Tax=Pseudoduganella guangdongensis TaxID=2692179 RepID=A0A6N9HG60_9BURK|nr:hypothetical protein [Pseudoduganella guangdongensis]MYN02440.1 hypothetical protein [Pseudoduganella guangdongensis]